VDLPNEFYTATARGPQSEDNRHEPETIPMNAREALSKHPGVGIGAAVACVLLAVGIIFLQTRGNSTPSEGDAKAFYTVDDGQTWFADDLMNLPPFDKDGKQAVRAFVFQGSDGKQFVGYLQRFTPEAKRAIEKISTPDPNRTGPPDASGIQMAYTVGREVKRPGDAKWINGGEIQKSLQITKVKCPDGSDAVAVKP
jgi:hypothetical protein